MHKKTTQSSIFRGSKVVGQTTLGLNIRIAFDSYLSYSLYVLRTTTLFLLTENYLVFIFVAKFKTAYWTFLRSQKLINHNNEPPTTKTVFFVQECNLDIVMDELLQKQLKRILVI